MIHVLPTDKPSRLFYANKGQELCIATRISTYSTGQNIYITSDEEIKEGDWVISNYGELIKISYKGSKVKENVNEYCKKIILTTDLDLIGVQSIDDEFLEWFVQHPSCEEVETFIDTMGCTLENCNANPCVNYKIIIPKEEPNKTHYLDELPNMDREVLAKMWESAMPKLEPKQEYEYIGECKGNNGNGCFMDSSGHDCGCFIKITKEQPKQELRGIPAGTINMVIGKPKQETLEENCTCTDECLGYLTKTCKGIETLEQIDQNNPVTKGSTALVYKQETLEEVAENYGNSIGNKNGTAQFDFIRGAKWQQEQDKNKYSDEEVLEIIRQYALEEHLITSSKPDIWFNKFKKK